MKHILFLFLIASTSFAVPLPHTLGGIAPGENMQAYYGKLGQPSTSMANQDFNILNWGTGLMVKVDKADIVLEVVITRKGAQQELGFDVEDTIKTAIEKLGEANTVTEKKTEYSWNDIQSGTELFIAVDGDQKISKISLHQIR
jgi:hypothetical protein